MLAKWVLIPVITFLSLPVHGHVGDRVVPVFEITDDALSKIDLHDGAIDEWTELADDPSLTPFDFVLYESLSTAREYHPADLDFRIWLAWNETHDRIYAGAIFSDDSYVNEMPDPPIMSFNDSMALLIDGDHSGGRYFGGGNHDVGEMRVHNSQAQFYEAIATTPEGPTVSLLLTSAGGEWSADWMLYPPYSDGGGFVVGESPTISVIEFYVTPFDDMIWNDEAGSTISDLKADMVIGVSAYVFDREAGAGIERDMYLMGGPRATADDFFDGLLLGERDTAVHADSWGRIKASLR